MKEKVKPYISYILCIMVSVLLGLFFKLCLVGYSFLSYVLFVFALVSAFYMVLRMLKGRYGKLCYTLNKLATYCIIIFLFAVGVTITVIAGDTKTDNNENADYAIVFGAGVNGDTPSRSLKARIDAAVRYAENNPETVFILSGGKGNGENISEAQCIKSYMVAAGVSESRLILEDKATNTFQNAKFSSEIIYSLDPDFDGKICVITEVYHVTRAKLCTEDMDFSVVVSQSGYSGLPILTANYYLREVFALWNYMVFVR